MKVTPNAAITHVGSTKFWRSPTRQRNPQREEAFLSGSVTNLSESLTKLVRARYELSASWRTGRWHSGENLGVRMLGDRDYCGMLHPPFGGDRAEVTRTVFDLGDILRP